MTWAIVCGGSNYDDAARVKRVMDAAVTRMGLEGIIEGGATGADTLAREWALACGEVQVINAPADWSRGKSAGISRNHQMLTMLLRHKGRKCVIAFAGGNGTAHMKKIARDAGIDVFEA